MFEALALAQQGGLILPLPQGEHALTGEGEVEALEAVQAAHGRHAGIAGARVAAAGGVGWGSSVGGATGQDGQAQRRSGAGGGMAGRRAGSRWQQAAQHGALA